MTDESVKAGYWTYDEWVAQTIEKIVSVSLTIPEENRTDWLRLQIGLAIDKALRHGLSGRTNSDPVHP
ncbi:hypothetical protein [Sphingomonas sanguinis]|uniref:Uncharacterized protein n=1 Tax=Sphingomonas sanguinis TaxID=33051 RepID=A0A147JD00_9SPHN|nr:hypothetical protein [Sphingomonas sanguinis]KTW17942.1 hypothetical protein NS258_01015 [Sphingomonas sanguinis]